MNMFLSLEVSDCGRRRLIREVAVLLLVLLIVADGKVPLGRAVMGGREDFTCWLYVSQQDVCGGTTT